jgi:thiazole synthase|tara:strand:+ start:2819 stop:3607 length:789 start_codon:yes stop_codon:yes gene_type:complete
MSTDEIHFGKLAFRSRLILGTGKFSSTDVMLNAIKASGTELVTVALKRFNRNRATDDLYAPLAELAGLTIMPNTSGARDATEAVRAAHLGRELSGSPIVKLEIHPNPHHLMPDPIETLEAARQLAADGFIVMPYMPADPVLAKRLEDVGCASLMPLGSAIGSGGGIATRDMLRLILRESHLPVIVDAGLRAPSEAGAAMEMGCAAVLVNSAIATAGDPVGMATAFADVVAAGCRARAAGLMTSGESAVPTSPLTSFLSSGAP